MKQIVESLKRLYASERITEKKINDMFTKGIINEHDRMYILRKEETDVHNTN